MGWSACSPTGADHDGAARSGTGPSRRRCCRHPGPPPPAARPRARPPNRGATRPPGGSTGGWRGPRAESPEVDDAHAASAAPSANAVAMARSRSSNPAPPPWVDQVVGDGAPVECVGHGVGIRHVHDVDGHVVAGVEPLGSRSSAWTSYPSAQAGDEVGADEAPGAGHRDAGRGPGRPSARRYSSADTRRSPPRWVGSSTVSSHRSAGAPAAGRWCARGPSAAPREGTAGCGRGRERVSTR